LALNPTETFLREMRRSFPVTARFGHLQLFEAENIFAMIIPPRSGIGEHHLVLQVYRPMPMDQIPDCVLAYTKDGGFFRGAFAPNLRGPGLTNR
jgi:hypothetical protein